MSYTLRGRLESRLAVTLVPLLVACALAGALSDWWPVELAGLMIGVGLLLDGVAYHRLLDYQPGWAALPIGLLELALVMVLVRLLEIDAPLGAALVFYAAAWLLSQVLGQAGFPLVRLSYAEDGGELGRIGAGAAALTLAAFATAGGLYWASRPPTVHLSAGVHEGPLVVTRSENVIGERGAVVRGGIVIRADDVTVRNVSVVGGENGISVIEADNVVLDGVSISGARLDGINVRRGVVSVRDCTIASPAGYTQGIDISFSADLAMSMVEGCTISGGQEGIVIDSASAMVHGNRVGATTLRAISINEMGMADVEENEVTGALGVGIFCGDRSMCEIRDNHVVGTRPDTASGDLSRLGYAIESHFGSEAELSGNELTGNVHAVGVFAGATVSRG
jgi:hypothetical protein